jgi:hypothetical protein
VQKPRLLWQSGFFLVHPGLPGNDAVIDIYDRLFADIER